MIDDDQANVSSMIDESKVEESVEDDDATLISRLPVYYPGISGCRSVEEFHCMNKIEEGTFGVVYRAKEKRTGK
jgi:cell division cycle 2-like protein